MAKSGYVRGNPEAEFWLGEIRRGIKFRRTYAHEHRWATWRNYYRGIWPRSVLPVNLYFRMLRTVVPRIYFRNPSISIQPTKPGPDQAAFAQLIERIDNKLMRTMRMKDQLKKITQQAWMFGTGIGKRGFAQEFKPAPDILGDGSAPDAIESKGTPIHRVEYHANVQENMPWFLKCNTGDFIVPADTCEFEEARWYANWIRRPQFEVQNDPRLKNMKDIPTTPVGQSLLSGQPDSTRRQRRDTVDLIEIHDTMTKKVFVIAPFHSSKVAYFEDDRLQVNNRPPYYKLVFNDDDEVFWGVPDSIILEPQQLELNEIRTLQMKHRRLALIKIMYKKDSIETTQLEKLLDGTVAAGVEIRGELSDIDHFQVADVPPSLSLQSQELLGDVRESMGFSRNQAGEYSEGRSKNPTATEANIVQAASEIRVDERRDMLADVIVDVFEDIHEDIFDRWQDDQIVQVMGPDNVPIWVAFKPEALRAAAYQFQIDPDTMVPETKGMRQAKSIQTYQLLKDNPLIDPEMLTKYLLREQHGVQYDNMMRQVQQNAAAGQQGSTPQKPIQMGEYIQRLAAGGGRRPT
jgi:hypothetical protein